MTSLEGWGSAIELHPRDCLREPVRENGHSVRGRTPDDKIVELRSLWEG